MPLCGVSPTCSAPLEASLTSHQRLFLRETQVSPELFPLLAVDLEETSNFILLICEMGIMNICYSGEL